MFGFISFDPILVAAVYAANTYRFIREIVVFKEEMYAIALVTRTERGTKFSLWRPSPALSPKPDIKIARFHDLTAIDNKEKIKCFLVRKEAIEAMNADLRKIVEIAAIKEPKTTAAAKQAKTADTKVATDPSSKGTIRIEEKASPKANAPTKPSTKAVKPAAADQLPAPRPKTPKPQVKNPSPKTPKKAKGKKQRKSTRKSPSLKRPRESEEESEAGSPKVPKVTEGPLTRSRARGQGSADDQANIIRQLKEQISEMKKEKKEAIKLEKEKGKDEQKYSDEKPDVVGRGAGQMQTFPPLQTAHHHLDLRPPTLIPKFCPFCSSPNNPGHDDHCPTRRSYLIALEAFQKSPTSHKMPSEPQPKYCVFCSHATQVDHEEHCSAIADFNAAVDVYHYVHNAEHGST